MSRYLLMQLVVNATYGIPIGVGLWLIGIPNALLWGVLATVLRFVPYVGPFIAALFPIALAVAVAPGWGLLFWTVALFLGLELVSNNVVEPWLYGSSTGISTVAILVAAIFWTTLVGPGGPAPVDADHGLPRRARALRAAAGLPRRAAGQRAGPDPAGAVLPAHAGGRPRGGRGDRRGVPRGAAARRLLRRGGAAGAAAGRGGPPAQGPGRRAAGARDREPDQGRGRARRPRGAGRRETVAEVGAGRGRRQPAWDGQAGLPASPAAPASTGRPPRCSPSCSSAGASARACCRRTRSAPEGIAGRRSRRRRAGLPLLSRRRRRGPRPPGLPPAPPPAPPGARIIVGLWGGQLDQAKDGDPAGSMGADLAAASFA